MSTLRITDSITSDRIDGRVVLCDGCDAERAIPEYCAEDRLVIVLRGVFSVRGPRTRMLADPSQALVLRAGDEFVIRHPLPGGDVCMSLAGNLVDAALERDARWLPVPARGWILLHDLAQTLHHQSSDPLDIEERFATALGFFAPSEPAGARGADQDISDAIDQAIRARFPETLHLAELVTPAGVCVFHACRAFRRARGMTIARFREDVRLRHALALLLDTTLPISEIAYEVGFANHGHLTNRFVRRFGLTPTATRRRRGLPVSIVMSKGV